ncbi:DUF4232 domain-containing protein [Pedococcus sp. KACC 23699]|uniref:DUF4232 domain-containing protein n=1 Tax=Pedococcus sp. KACC 23699 TaxID=3149228 RepID=A0AAU7JXM1_9MICO
MQSWGRWCSRALVVGSLLLLVTVAWRYGSYTTVFGDTPCERDSSLCDDAANAVAQRELGRWFLAACALLAAGLVATAVRRSIHPRRGVPAGSERTSPPRVVVAAAFGWGVLSFVPVLLTIVFWFFGGTAIYLTVGISWCVLLAFLLDRSHRRRVPAEGDLPDLGSFLVSGAAAVVGVVGGCSAGVVAGSVLRPGSESAAFVLVPLVIALGAGVGTALVVASEQLLAGPWTPVAPPATASAVVAVVVLVAGVLLTVGTPVGRGLVAGVRNDLFPVASTRVQARPPVLADPRPDLSSTEPPDPAPPPTPAPVRADRPCAASDLALTAEGWDSAMGSTAMSVVATNTSSTPCWVRGYPQVRLAQGGTDLNLSLTRSPTHRWGNGDVVPDRRIGLAAHGGRASFDLWWKGYRQAADQQTPQSMTVSTPGTGPMVLGLSAPYLLDVVADAEVTVMRWKVPSLGTG